MTNTCMQCSGALAEGHRFCPHCGTRNETTISSRPGSYGPDLSPSVEASANAAVFPAARAVEWFYTQDGKRLGPVAADALPGLAVQGTITADTPVWRQGFSDWIPAGQSELGAILWANTQTPPALTGDQVSNSIVWVVAFVPVISWFIQVEIGQATGTPTSDHWYVALVLNIVLCLIDEKRLKNAGQNMKGLSLGTMFLVPVYLFWRAARLKQNNAYAWVWLVCFAVSLVVKS